MGVVFSLLTKLFIPLVVLGIAYFGARRLIDFRQKRQLREHRKLNIEAEAAWHERYGRPWERANEQDGAE